jgi:hypothetical protein
MSMAKQPPNPKAPPTLPPAKTEALVMYKGLGPDRVEYRPAPPAERR